MLGFQRVAAGRSAARRLRAILFAVAVGALLGAVGVADADTAFLCTTETRNSDLISDRFEYVVSGRSGSVDVRDAITLAQVGGWVPAEVSARNAQRLSFGWSIGPLPQRSGWWQPSMVIFRFTVLNGGRDFKVTARVDREKRSGVLHIGEGTCAPAS